MPYKSSLLREKYQNVCTRFREFHLDRYDAAVPFTELAVWDNYIGASLFGVVELIGMHWTLFSGDCWGNAIVLCSCISSFLPLRAQTCHQFTINLTYLITRLQIPSKHIPLIKQKVRAFVGMLNTCPYQTCTVISHTSLCYAFFFLLCMFIMTKL